MTAYLKKSFVYNWHYWIEQNLGFILMPLSEALDGGVRIIPLELSGRHFKIFPLRLIDRD